MQERIRCNFNSIVIFGFVLDKSCSLELKFRVFEHESQQWGNGINFSLVLHPHLKSKMPNVFVSIGNCICQICQIYLNKVGFVELLETLILEWGLLRTRIFIQQSNQSITLFWKLNDICRKLGIFVISK